MKQVGSADFRRGYASMVDTVEVTAYGRVIGTWYPSGEDLPLPTVEQIAAEPPDPSAPAPRMTIRPDQGRRAVVVGEKRIVDTADLARQERRHFPPFQGRKQTPTDA